MLRVTLSSTSRQGGIRICQPLVSSHKCKLASSWQGKPSRPRSFSSNERYTRFQRRLPSTSSGRDQMKEETKSFRNPHTAMLQRLAPQANGSASSVPPKPSSQTTVNRQTPPPTRSSQEGVRRLEELLSRPGGGTLNRGLNQNNREASPSQPASPPSPWSNLPPLSKYAPNRDRDGRRKVESILATARDTQKNARNSRNGSKQQQPQRRQQQQPSSPFPKSHLSRSAFSPMGSNPRDDEPKEDLVVSMRRNFLPNGAKQSTGSTFGSALQNRPSVSSLLSTPSKKLPRHGGGHSSDPVDVSKLRMSLLRDKKAGSENNAPFPSLFGDSTTNTTSIGKPGEASYTEESPLTSVIRQYQLRQQAENQAKGLGKEGKEPMTNRVPRWRTHPRDSRLQQQARRPHQNNNSNNGFTPASGKRQNWADEIKQRLVQRNGSPSQARSRRTSRYAMQQRKIIVPVHPMNLIEFSQLLRVTTKRLRLTLQAITEKRLERSQADEAVSVDPDTMELIAIDLGFPNVERATSNASTTEQDEESLLQRRAMAEEESAPYQSFPPRPPVVCIMGHVDHGKTTLMDALRRRAREANKSETAATKKKKGKKKKNKDQASKAEKGDDVAGTEAGGITQVISAFQVPLADEEVGAVTFLDTPGHAAFSAMRQSGSDAADIIVLVVAADDGVSEQTVEIINFYKSIVEGSGGGGITMVVAMNKIDKPGVNVEQAKTKVEMQLLEHGILTEDMAAGSTEGEFGQPVQLIPVSGLTGEGLDDLIDGLIIQSEVMDLRADDTARAEGVILDARIEKGLGIVVDCIIRWGSISKGDAIVSGTSAGKVRILKDVNNSLLKKGYASQPVRIVGFDTLPTAGDPILCMESEEEANELLERRMATKQAEETESSAGQAQAELQSSGKHLMSYEWKERLEKKHGIEYSEDTPVRIPVIVRADADGTLAAIRDALVSIGVSSKHNIVIDPIQESVGPALPADVERAKLSNASIVCFNLKANQTISRMANEEEVQFLSSDVIYTLLDEARESFGKYLPAISSEVVHGRATVGAVFDIGGIDTRVAGLQVVEGTLYKNKAPGDKAKIASLYRVLRNGVVISDSNGTDGLQATSLKHFKEDVEDVTRGKECGLSLVGHNDYEEGDVVECFSIEVKHQAV